LEEQVIHKEREELSGDGLAEEVKDFAFIVLEFLNGTAECGRVL